LEVIYLPISNLGIRGRL